MWRTLKAAWSLDGGADARVGIDNAGRSRKLPRRVLDVLGYQAMLPSGIAWLGEDEWSITLRLLDINYESADTEIKESILDQWGRFINSYGGGIRIQQNVINRVLDDEAVADMIQMQPRQDAWDHWREDFNNIVRGRLALAANTVTEKYVTITLREPDPAKAEHSLTRIATEAIATLRSMEDCEAVVLKRTERMRLLSHLLRPGEPLTFDEASFTETESTAHYLAPWSIETTTKDGPLHLHSGSHDTWQTTLWLRDFPAWLTDQLTTALTDIKADVNVALHLEPYDKEHGMNVIRRQVAELEMQTIAEKKKAGKRGYGDAFLPHALVSAIQETKELRDDLQHSSQKLIDSVLLISITAPTRVELDERVSSVERVIRRLSCSHERTAFMQRDALTATLPLGLRRVPMRRTLTTASAAVMLPFTTQEAFQPGGCHYGSNATSSNMVVVDRTRSMNGNGFILGVSGSGKSMSAKNEIVNVFLDRPDDDLLIIDPEREYQPIIEAMGGATVRIGPGSTARLNPLDIDLDDTVDGDPITRKCSDVLDMIGSLIGGYEGLSDVQRSLIDRCTKQMYQRYAADTTQPMPTLVDLRHELEQAKDEEADYLARSLEIYTEGSLGAFSEQTNVDVRNRFVAFDISQLGPALTNFGMLVVLDHIWKRVVRNHREGRRTWIWTDEFHVMFANPYSTAFFKNLYKRARKKGAIPTGITQNVEELRGNDDAALMLANSDFLLLLRQAKEDADALTGLLRLSDEQAAYVRNPQKGCGLIKTGNSIVPFDGTIPATSELFALFDTKFDDSRSLRDG